MINIGKYFIEVVNEDNGYIGYDVMFPEELLTEIIKQNKQLLNQTQTIKELERECAELQAFAQRLRELLALSTKTKEGK